MNAQKLQSQCFDFINKTAPADAAHDISHIKRVVKTTLYLTDIEESNLEITLPAACLHDCVAVPKNSPLRSQGSRLAAEAAVEFLSEIEYPAELLPDIAHAIEAHSFSANIPCRTLEAKVVQDADRMDALGAIGIARCLIVGGQFGSAIFNPDDPFCENREPDDKAYAVDHFYAKLFKLPGTMQTEAGRVEAQRRVDLMQDFLDNLRNEIT
jgi:uncharacterized protein